MKLKLSSCLHAEPRGEEAGSVAGCIGNAWPVGNQRCRRRDRTWGISFKLAEKNHNVCVVQEGLRLQLLGPPWVLLKIPGHALENHHELARPICGDPIELSAYLKCFLSRIHTALRHPHQGHKYISYLYHVPECCRIRLSHCTVNLKREW